MLMMCLKGSQCQLTFSRHVEVEIETVLALVGEQGQQLFQEKQPASGKLEQGLGAIADVGRILGTDGAESVRQSRALPEGWRHRRHVPKTQTHTKILRDSRKSRHESALSRYFRL